MNLLLHPIYIASSPLSTPIKNQECRHGEKERERCNDSQNISDNRCEWGKAQKGR
jgi:hypothetical protein